MQEPVRNAMPPAADFGLPMPQLNPEAQRGLSIAILRARPDCCNVCRALMPLQEALFRELESPTPAPVSLELNDAGGIGESFANYAATNPAAH